MTWIKIENVTPDKPEIYVIAETLGIDPDAVLGKLIRVWIWADEQTFDGNALGNAGSNALSVTRALLDRLTCVTGFADALCSAGWIKPSENGFVFTNFDRHNGATAKQRGLNAKRQEKFRAKQEAESNAGSNASSNGVSNASSVTNASPRIELELDTNENENGKTKRKRASKFKAPTVEEVKTYAAEQAFEIDADRFVAFYESKGWKVGNQPMANWRAAAKGWHNRTKTGQGQQAPRVESHPSAPPISGFVDPALKAPPKVDMAEARRILAGSKGGAA